MESSGAGGSIAISGHFVAGPSIQVAESPGIRQGLRGLGLKV